MTEVPRDLNIEGVNDAMYNRILPRLREIHADKRYDHIAPENIVLKHEEEQLLTTAIEFFHWNLEEMRERFQDIVKNRTTEGGRRIKWDQIDDLVVSIFQLDRMRAYETKQGISLLNKYRGKETKYTEEETS